MNNEKIEEEIAGLMDLHNIYDRGDYIDGYLDALEMVLKLIKNSG